jgi:lipopolysaccharide transport system ATP-binding protein
MDAIERLCNKGLFLQNGELVKQGTINSVLENYLSGNLKLNAINNFDNEDFSKLPFELTKIYTHQDDFIISDSFNVVDTIGITIEFSVKSETNLFIPAISVLNDKELDVFHSHDVDSENYKSFWKKGNYKSTVWIPKNLLSEGNYIIGLGMLAHLPFHVYYHQKELLRIKFSDLIKGDSARGLYNGEFPGVFRPKLIWETIEL